MLKETDREETNNLWMSSESCESNRYQLEIPMNLLWKKSNG